MNYHQQDTFVTCTCGSHYINKVNKLVHTRDNTTGAMVLLPAGKLPTCANDVINGLTYAEEHKPRNVR